MLNIPTREQTKLNDTEHALLAAWQTIELLNGGEYPEDLLRAVKEYTSLYTKTQLHRVASQLWSENSFDTSRKVLEKAEAL